VIWTRADRPAAMHVEWSTTESFANAHKLRPLMMTQATDHAGKLTLAGLPSDQDIP
jgi:alkaline phosphatase D